MSEFETMHQLKELLDAGIISQKEFDEKKRAILFPDEIEAEKKAEEERLAIDTNNAVLYAAAIRKIDVKEAESYRAAISDLEKIGDWRDAPLLLEKCKSELPELEKKMSQLDKLLESVQKEQGGKIDLPSANVESLDNEENENDKEKNKKVVIET